MDPPSVFIRRFFSSLSGTRTILQEEKRSDRQPEKVQMVSDYHVACVCFWFSLRSFTAAWYLVNIGFA